MQPITVGFSPCPSSAAYNSGVQPVSFLCITGITGITGITVGTFLGDVKVHLPRLPLFKSNSRPGGGGAIIIVSVFLHLPRNARR